jgi:hypothetical protein
MACPVDSGEVLHDYITISCFCVHSCSVGDLLIRPREHDVYAQSFVMDAPTLCDMGEISPVVRSQWLISVEFRPR